MTERSTKRQKELLMYVDAFIKEHKQTLSKKIAFWTGHNIYTINMILQVMIKTCVDNNMYLMKSEKETRMELMAMLASQTHHSTIFSPIKIMM